MRSETVDVTISPGTPLIIEHYPDESQEYIIKFDGTFLAACDKLAWAELIVEALTSHLTKDVQP
jgi:hypothetical protein